MRRKNWKGEVGNEKEDSGSIIMGLFCLLSDFLADIP